MTSQSQNINTEDGHKLAAIIESSDDAIISKDLNGVIRSWNNGAQRIFGYEASEVIGQPISILIPKDRYDEEPMILEKIKSGQRVDHYETVRRRKDGKLINVSITVSPIKGSDGKVTGASKIARDISIQRQAENLNNRMAAIVESSDDAIISKNLDGIITSWNRGAEMIFGYKAEEVIGHPVVMLIPQERHNEEPSILEKLRRGEKIDHYETVRQRKDGKLIDVSLTVSPIRDRHGKVVGASKIARDITQQKKDQEELARSNKELEQFAYVASHDLQEPLQMVKSFADLLYVRSQEKLNEKEKEYLNFIRQGAAQAKTLINELLEYSRLGRNENKQDINLQTVMREVLNSLRATIDRTHATIDYPPLPVVRGRHLEIVQLFQNLLSNSMKYRGENNPHIQIEFTQKEERWLFRFKDNGIGIEPEYKERIFEMFQRLHTKSEYTGTGIGLAICKKVVEYHGGKIWVESVPGQGSTFCFTLKVM